VTTGVVQVQTTLDTEAAASRVADTLVSERLAACVQVVGPARSTYHWKGALERAEEWLCLIKTTEAGLPRLTTRLREIHPYDTPEILVLPVTAGLDDYLAWVRETVSREQGAGSREQ
jgi:periplasmic divalent cation tolerance protein